MMNLVRKRNSSSLKGGPAKSIRTEKPQSVRQPASHNASSPLTTEASGIVTTSKEERGLEVHGTSSPWRRSPRFKSQSLLGQVPSADLLVAEGSPGQVENEEEAVQCSPAQCPPQTEEDTDTDLVITMDERHGGGYKGSRKKGGVKRKKRAADRELGERQQEGAGPEVEIDRELDRELENKSRQHNLTTANVRNIIHEVITNEHVVAMMKAAINETEAMPVFEPKMTRSKFKEVVEKGVVIPTWNISPIKKVNKEKAPQFVDIQLAEEDSSDEEYCPDEEEEDETAEDTFQESDMESTASSPRGTRGGFHRKIHTEWDDDRSCSPMQVNHSRSRHLKVEVVPMGPPPPPQPSSSSGPHGFYTTRAPPEFSFLEKLHAVEEELAIGPVCLEPYQPPLADGLMACRTRSKRPLRDVPMGQLEAELCAPDITPDMYGCDSAPEDPEWTHWLQGIMTSDMYNDEEGDDDDDDPEYNFLAEIDEPDVEDYRNDRAVRITKKEVNQLMEELFETFQDELTAQEQDGEGHEEEEEREEEAPALGTPTFNTPPDIPLEDPMAEVTAGRYRTVKQQLEAIRRRRALLESQGLLVPRALITKPREPPPPFTPTLSHHQRLQLQQQVQQHVQLLTQVHMLTSPVAALQSEAATTKQFLMELQMFAQRGELTQGPVEPGFTSVFRACNLQGALSLLEELRLSPIPYQEAPNEPRTCRRVRKHPSMPPQLAWLFATRPVFLYPELLPHVSLDPALHSARSVSMFTAGEDCLIVLGLRNLGETLQPKELLCHYLLRAKRVSQLRDHIMEKCKHTHPNNVIKAYQLQKVVLPMPVACERVEPGDLRPSVEREERAMPGWLRRSLPYIYEAIRELNSSPDTEAMSACQSKKAPLVTLLFSSSRTLDYSFPPGTRYPPQLPDSLSFQRCGFRRWHRPPPCDLSLSLAVSHNATQSLGSGTTCSENNSQTGAVIQQCMAHHKLRPIQPATFKPPSLQHPTKPHLKRPLKPQHKPSQKPLHVILNLPAPVPATVLCPAPSARVLASRLSHFAPLAKDLVARKFSTFANLRRLPRLLPAPPPNNKNPPQTNLNTVAPNSGANLLLLPHMSSRTASTVTETQTSVSTTTPIEQFKKKSSRTSRRRVTKKPKSSLKSERKPQPSASTEPPALDQALTPYDYVTVVMEEEGVDERDEDGGDFDMPLLALSESSASPPGSVDPAEESEEGQEITLNLSPGPSDMGDRNQEVEEVMSPASEESTLSVPELQETMEKLSWLASGGRSEDLEEGERSGTPSECHSSSPNPPSSRHEQRHTGEVGSKGISKSPPIVYDDDLLDSDPLREKKEIAFAQNYLNRVCHALQEVPGRVEEFLEVLYEFEQDGDEHTSVELFTRLKPVLNEWPELLRDFAAFLHPEQAQECGLLSEQQAFERSRHFLRQLELSFGENSSHYRKIVSVLRGPTLSPAGIKEVKSQIANLLRGHTHLQGEFWVFFNELHLRPSLQCQTENRGRGDVTNTNSTSQKSSAANKPKRCKGTKATQVKAKEGDRYTHPEPSVCAKNISLTPSGEKVILWTREADRAILTACQQKGANKITFEAVSAQLGNKTANEVCVRFQDLMRLFLSSTERVYSDEEVSDTEPTSSREPDPD